jgi:TPR repeat protein
MRFMHVCLIVVIVCCIGCHKERDKSPMPPYMTQLLLKGGPEELYEVGKAYETGRGTPINIVEAAKWYYQAASRGHIHSHYAIWRLWEDFSNLDLDPPFDAEQFNISRKAAIAGYEKMLETTNDIELFYRLGLLYDPGISVGGVEARLSKKYLTRAADMGHKRAIEFLSLRKEFERGK